MVQVGNKVKALKCSNLVGFAINAVSRDENVKKIERRNRVIEERGKFYRAILPFYSLTRMMVMNLLKK